MMIHDDMDKVNPEELCVLKEQVSPLERKKEKGFTMIELMIAVAVIGILSALVGPMVFDTLSDAKITTITSAQETLKTATGHSILKSKVMPASLAAMITDQSLDKNPLDSIKVGNSNLFSVSNGLTVGAAPGNGYDLSQNGTIDTKAGQLVAQIRIWGVSPEDALAINLAIDGAANAPALNAADTKGAVEYGAIAAGATGSVYIYVISK